MLEQTQKGGLDITAWLIWFLDTLNATLEQAQQAITRTLAKSRFWQQHGGEPLSAEQIKVLNRMLDGGENGFLQGISASQYQKVAKVSKATATRHLADLLEKGCLEKCPEEVEIPVIRSRLHGNPHIVFRGLPLGLTPNSAASETSQMQLFVECFCFILRFCTCNSKSLSCFG